MKSALDAWGLLACLCASCVLGKAAPAGETNANRPPEPPLNTPGRIVADYHTRPPVGTPLVVDSGDFFHPVYTPRGVVITDLAPSDHPHHRGVFLGWVEMHGAKDADFWGWGEHAPIRGRRIVNRSFGVTDSGLESTSDWVAEGVILIREKLTVRMTNTGGVNLLDLDYALTPASDLKLTRWAFSGFCLRTRKEGAIEFFSPAGAVALPNPSHLKPESDWPDAPWYACTVKLEGSLAGAAIVNHPANPPTLWHNHRDVRMLNPCIVAPAEVSLKKDQPLRLRYLVVTFDGEVPTAVLNNLAADFRK
jgi:hypothetical protein